MPEFKTVMSPYRLHETDELRQFLTGEETVSGHEFYK